MSSAIRNLIYAFLPLLAYILADYFFGLIIGLIVAVCLGSFQLIYDKIIEKQWNKLLIIDLALIILFSSISYYLNDNSFFKWKALALEIFTLLFLIFITRTESNYLAENLIRFSKKINKETLIVIRRQLKRLIMLLILHSFYLSYVILNLSDALYLIVVGPLFYGLIAIIFIFQILEQRYSHFYWQLFYKNDEQIPIIDKQGNILFIAPRKIAHRHPEWIHPTVHLILINKQKEIYLQKRSKNKKTYPFHWDSSVGGHVKAGQTIESALKQESLEELGINLVNFKFINTYIWENTNQTELVYFFISNQESEIKIDQVEISDGRYWQINAIKNETKEKFTKHLLEFELPMLETIKVV